MLLHLSSLSYFIHAFTRERDSKDTIRISVRKGCGGWRQIRGGRHTSSLRLKYRTHSVSCAVPPPVATAMHQWQWTAERAGVRQMPRSARHLHTSTWQPRKRCLELLYLVGASPCAVVAFVRTSTIQEKCKSCRAVGNQAHVRLSQVACPFCRVVNNVTSKVAVPPPPAVPGTSCCGTSRLHHDEITQQSLQSQPIKMYQVSSTSPSAPHQLTCNLIFKWKLKRARIFEF